MKNTDNKYKTIKNRMDYDFQSQIDIPIRVFVDAQITDSLDEIEYLKQFMQWYEDGNVVKQTEEGVVYYRTQDSQYRNKIEGKHNLYLYFKNEFINQ